MSTVTYIMSALQVISALVVIVLVMFQKLKEGNGLSGSTNEGASGMGMSKDKKLSRFTILFGILFVVFTVIASTLIYRDLH